MEKRFRQAIETQIAVWADSSEEPYGGKLWGYRRGMPVRPSHIRNWAQYLESIRKSALQIVVPKIELRWVVDALPDPADSARTTVHLALENWTAPLTKTNQKELEPAFFQLSLEADLGSDAHQLLRLACVSDFPGRFSGLSYVLIQRPLKRPPHSSRA